MFSFQSFWNKGRFKLTPDSGVRLNNLRVLYVSYCIIARSNVICKSNSPRNMAKNIFSVFWLLPSYTDPYTLCEREALLLDLVRAVALLTSSRG